MNKSVISTVVVGVAVVAVATYALFFRGETSVTGTDTTTNTQQANQEVNNSIAMDTPTTGECTRDYNPDAFTGKTVDFKNKVATLKVKNFGEIQIELNDDAAPKTVENFVKLSQSGFYNCLTFHRIAKDFVVQGGDPAGNGTGGPGYTIPAEIKLLHTKGAIAMARTGDQVNPERASSGSQFYIALEPLPMLDGAYTVFGKVVKGMDIVEKIGGVEIIGSQDGPPKEPVVIESVTIANK